VARGRGYLTITDPAAARAVEIDTQNCAHCQRVIKQHNADGTRKTSIGMCLMCGPAQICDACERDGKCTPFERKLEQIEARGRLLAAAGG